MTTHLILYEFVNPALAFEFSKLTWSDFTHCCFLKNKQKPLTEGAKNVQPQNMSPGHILN